MKKTFIEYVQPLEYKKKKKPEPDRRFWRNDCRSLERRLNFSCCPNRLSFHVSRNVGGKMTRRTCYRRASSALRLFRWRSQRRRHEDRRLFYTDVSKNQKLSSGFIGGRFHRLSAVIAGWQFWKESAGWTRQWQEKMKAIFLDCVGVAPSYIFGQSLEVCSFILCCIGADRHHRKCQPSLLD
jgi:hypothetical protein